jgi:hypothetical protein
VSYWDAMTAANIAADDGEGLTLEKLQAAIDSIPKPPPEPKFDLFGSPAISEAYEIDMTKTMPELMPPGSKGRRFLVVPKDRLLWWYDALRKAGADVRLEPRISPASSQGEGDRHGS